MPPLPRQELQLELGVAWVLWLTVTVKRWQLMSGDAKTNEADRVGAVEGHLLQQLFSQGQQLVFGAEGVVLGDGARDLREVTELYLERQGAPFELALGNAAL